MLLIGAAHLLLVTIGVYFNSLYARPRRYTAANPVLVLVTIPLRLPMPVLPLAARHPFRPSATRTAPGARQVPAPATSRPEAPTVTPVDWARESRLAANVTANASARKAESAPRAFGAPLTPATVRCKPPKADFNWNPEPKKAGFIGVLPYVRLGHQCIVGLGFFGCGLGKPPEPNSQLLDKMNDGNRRRTSVPDIPNCVEGPEETR